MSIKLRVSVVTERHVRGVISGFGMSMSEFMAWKDAVEFDIDNKRDERLRFVAKRGAYEYQSIEKSGNRKFKAIWEIEWNGQSETFQLLELSLIEISPKLQ